MRQEIAVYHKVTESFADDVRYKVAYVEKMRADVLALREAGYADSDSCLSSIDRTLREARQPQEGFADILGVLQESMGSY